MNSCAGILVLSALPEQRDRFAREARSLVKTNGVGVLNPHPLKRRSPTKPPLEQQSLC